MHRRDVSFVEKGLWSLHQSAGTGVCNTSVAVEIRSPLDTGRLAAALAAVVRRHEALRTRYLVADGELRAAVLPAAEPEFTATGAEGLADDELAAAVTAEHDRPLDLAGGGLCRMRVWTREPERHLVLLTVHHAAVDWTAMVVCAEEVCLLYADPDGTTLPPLGAPYEEFVAEQRAMLAGVEGEQAWRYWSSTLPAQRPEPPVPARAPRTGGQAAQRVLPFVVPPGDAARVQRSAWRYWVPGNVLLLGLWLLAVHQVAGAPTVVTGLPRTLRTRRFARTVGCFVNTMPLTMDLTGISTTDQLLPALRERLSGAVGHQGYPIELLAGRLPELGGVRGRPPIYDVTFNYVPRDGANLVPLVTGVRGLTVRLGGLTMSPFPAPPSIGPVADFTLHHTETPDQLVGMVGYDAALFDDETAAGLRDRYLELIARV